MVNSMHHSMIDLTQIHPVSDFIRNYKSYLLRIKQTRKPEVLTVNGVPEFVVVDARRFQEMQDAYDRARFVQAVNEGIASMNSGEGKPAAKSFQDIKDDFGI